LSALLVLEQQSEAKTANVTPRDLFLISDILHLGRKVRLDISFAGSFIPALWVSVCASDVSGMRIPQAGERNAVVVPESAKM
jgi:hypothetical protein